MTQLFLHGFGTRYDLPAPLVLYLFVGGFVVVVSFVLVALFAGDRLGERAVRYPRRRARLLDPLVNSRAVRIAGRALGLAWLLAVIVTGFFGSPTAYYNPAEYLVWVYFWALLVVLSGAVGNLWDWVNPWIPLHAALDRLSPLKPRPLPKRRLPSPRRPCGRRARPSIGPRRPLPSRGRRQPRRRLRPSWRP